MDTSKFISKCSLCSKVERFSSQKSGYYLESENLYVALGEHAFFKGYSVIILKDHRTQYHDLPEKLRLEVSGVQVTVARALTDLYGCSRLNYACLGNQVEHLHWHLFPRYLDESDRYSHPWKYQEEFSRFVLSDGQYNSETNRLSIECQKLQTNRSIDYR